MVGLWCALEYSEGFQAVGFPFEYGMAKLNAFWQYSLIYALRQEDLSTQKLVACSIYMDASHAFLHYSLALPTTNSSN